MKVYNLGCEHRHRFEGWFSSEEDSQSQLQRHAIACPICGSAQVGRMPSAPRLNLSAGSSENNPAQMQAKLLDMLRKAVAGADDVGERFAEEARRIHYRETAERPIRGSASAEECQALAEEGIDVIALPAAVLPKQNLQ